VSVPVLSNAIASILLASSKNSPPLYKIPDLNAMPLPTDIDVGVASPSAHGHEITKTATAGANALAILPSPPKMIHTKKMLRC
jgi:hypothetical protein